MKKKVFRIAVMGIMAVVLVGCGTKQQTDSLPTATPVPTSN